MVQVSDIHPRFMTPLKTALTGIVRFDWTCKEGFFQCIFEGQGVVTCGRLWSYNQAKSPSFLTNIKAICVLSTAS